MRQGSILDEGSIDGFHALGAFGQPVHQSYVQLRAAIEQKLGPRYANFFARPQIDERGKWIRWVSPVPGAAVGWRDLSREEQAERALDLQIMRSEFARYRDELSRQPARPDDRRSGEAFAAILAQALQTPNDAHLHFIGDQPVATFWGFTEHGAPGFEPLAAVPRGEPSPTITAAAPSATADDPPAAAVGATTRQWRWWPAALAGLLLLLLLWLFLWPIGPRLELQAWLPGATDPTEAVRPDEPPLVDGGLISRERSVEGEGGVVVEGEGVVEPDGGTAVIPDEQAGLPVAPEAPGSDASALPEALEPDAGQEGSDLAAPGAETVPPEAPGEESLPPESQDQSAQTPPATAPDPSGGPDAAPAAGEPLAIPERAAGGSGPADFLQGRWSSRSGLVDEASGAQLNQAYEFDRSGRGRSIVRRADGAECSAPAEARMENGRLMVRELEDLRCPDGQSFERSETACTRDVAGRTTCRGAYVGGQSFDVQIDRASP